MDYFPAFLNLRGRPCLLVGGGSVAARKARVLLAAGAELTVVAPHPHADMVALIDARHALQHHDREFCSDDVDGYWLVVCATENVDVRRSVAAAADAARVFCNTVDDIETSSYVTPAIVDRGAIIVAISSGGTAPLLARRIRAQIESLLPATIAQLAALAGRWRRRVAGRIGEFGARRRFWERVFDGRVARLVHAGDVETAEAELQRMLAGAVTEADGGGHAWLVGAGPGDPELLTLRALQIMQAADVIVHDRLVSEAVLSLARRDAERISVGKVPGCTRNGQDEINELLVSLVAVGKRVCRLKGGDPFIFGRGGEEVEALASAGLPVEVVPGITAAAGCAAAARIPLTHRALAQSVVLLTAHTRESIDTLDWPSLASGRQTLAIYMAVRRLPEVMNKLIAHGRPADTRMAIIENGTTPKQRIVRGALGQLTLLAEAHHIEAPAMLLVGDVARHGLMSGAHASDRHAVRTRPDNSAIHKMVNNR